MAMTGTARLLVSDEPCLQQLAGTRNVCQVSVDVGKAETMTRIGSPSCTSPYLAAAVLSSLLLLATSSAENPPAPLSVAVTAPKSCLKSGASLSVSIAMTNTSDHDVPYRVVAFGKWGLAFKISVYDSAGKPARITKDNPDSFKGGSVFSAKVQLAPGKSVQTKVDIGREYNLAPGNYTVEVEPLTDEKFESAPVTICISQ